MRIAADDLEIMGVTARYSRQSCSGHVLNCDYCPACGSRLFHRRDTYGAEINIKAGSLDDTSWFKPAGHIWTGSKQKWVTLPAGELTYEDQPSDYEAMKRRWREMTS